MSDTDPLAPLTEALGDLEEWQALDAAKLTITKIPDSQLLELRLWISDVEQPRRERAQAVSQAQADIITDLQANGVLTPPETADATTPKANIPAWVNPGTDHSKMYLYGAIIEHQGRIYLNNHAGLNSWEPGAPGVHAHDNWQDITDHYEQPAEDAEPTENEPEVAEYKQPTGGHDSYAKGAQVTYQGAVYESLIDNNVWAPDAYPAGWQKL